MFGVQDQDQDAQSNEWNKPPRRGKRTVPKLAEENRHDAKQELTSKVSDLSEPEPEVAPPLEPDAPRDTAEWYAGHVNACLLSGLQSFIDAGRRLNEAKEKLKHGEFLKMFEAGKLRIDKRTAQMLMRIANHPELSNTHNYAYLPPTLNSLHELSKIPPPEFAKLIEDGSIHPEMAIEDTKALVVPKSVPTPERPARRHRPPRPADLNYKVVLWNDRSSEEPTNYYNRATYPNIVLVHLWPEGTFHLRRLGWCDREKSVVITVLAGEEKGHEYGGVSVISLSRLCSISVRGEIPPQAEPIPTVVKSVEDLIETVKLAWPAARRILVGLSTREGWEPYEKKSSEKMESSQPVEP